MPTLLNRIREKVMNEAFLKVLIRISKIYELVLMKYLNFSDAYWKKNVPKHKGPGSISPTGCISGFR